MILFLIRHGQSQNNARPESERVEDPPLTEIGRRQTERLADWAAQANLSRVVSSPFRRALLTAKPIVDRTGLPAEVVVDLHERGGCYRGHVPGQLEGRPGMSREDINEEFGDFSVPHEIDGEGWWASRPHEDDRSVHERAIRLGRYLVDRFGDRPEERVALVSHADFKLIFSALHGGVAMPDFPANVFNTAVSEFHIEDGMIHCRSFNKVHHLSDDLKTL